MDTLITKILYLGGMTCDNCARRIANKLRAQRGVAEAQVEFSTARATIVFDAQKISATDLIAAIEKLNYTADETAPKTGAKIFRAAKYAVLIAGLYAVARNLTGSSLITNLPIAASGAKPAALFLLGVITSLHCVAMCGGINLSQCLQPADGGAVAKIARRKLYLPGLLYNGGRIISYTAVGAIVGAIGAGLSLTAGFKGAIQIFAGAFMLLLGVKMLGLFDFSRYLKFFKSRRAERGNFAAGRSPLIVGLLNGLMPCGPLQAMQLFALGSGNAVSGASAMLMFALGTTPLIFFLGALSAILSRRATARILRGGAILVIVMGLTMFANGWGLTGFRSPIDFLPTHFFHQQQSARSSLPPIIDGVQTVNAALSAGNYPAITVRAGVPVKWIITAAAENINGCNYRMQIPAFGIEHTFQAGDNVIEFTPTAAGRVPFSCWMGMIRGAITVIANEQEAIAEEKFMPAGVIIPSEQIAIAEIAGGTQTVRIVMTDDGIAPAIIVAQENLPLRWEITNASLDDGNSAMLIPAYAAKIKLSSGDNHLQFTPRASFAFSTLDNVYFGFVKTVADLQNFDADAVRREAANYETLIYPDSHYTRDRFAE